MAVAGINNVSALERWGNQERPFSRTSFIRKMWRDLEEETKNREVRSRMGSQCSCSSEGGESEHLSINTSELENECPGYENQMEIGSRNGDEENGNLCLQQSPAIGTADKERVRQVFREWGSKNGSGGRVLKFSRKNDCSRGQSACENECNRVRTVRQWIESNSQQAESGSSAIEEQVSEIGSRKSVRMLYGRHDLLDLLKSFAIARQNEIQSLLENGPVTNFAHRNRLQSLLRGRFLWNQRFVQDKKSASVAASELGILRQSTVSDLRKGFLSRSDNDEQSNRSDTSSDNGSKYHQENIQELPDGLVNNREGTYVVDSETEPCCTPRESDAPVENSLEQVLVNEQEQPLLSTEMDECQDSDQDQEILVEQNQGAHYIEPAQHTLELESPGQSPPPSPSVILHDQYESDGDELEVHDAFDPLNPSETNEDILSWQGAEEWQEPIVENNDIEWHHLTNPESHEGSDANSIENDEEWYRETALSDDDDDGDTAESWLAPPAVRTDAFYTTDNSDRPELQELMSRRRVSNLLQSDFRVRLDQLIQSYVERQEQASQSDDEWMLDHEQQDHEQQSMDGDDVREAIERADSLHSTPPAIPQHAGTEWEIINGLRFDMIRLQEQMNSMQSTLETCMKMQHELRRSVQQEVSSALSQISNSGEDSSQTCVLCRENSSSDSSSDRCGHVYVCSNCAQKINWSKLKESVRHP